ncbi:MAG: amidohydrolase, partial [Novosphingobium sp.]
QTIKPSDLVRRHFLFCFVDDRFGLKNVDEVGIDNIAYECDYPHSDTLWPEVPEHLWPTLNHLSDEQIAKITWKNAVKWFRFEDFQKYNKLEDMTVGACRARAAAKGVDTTPKSSGGARPVEDAGLRPVTSGDIMAMFGERLGHTEPA